MEDQEAPKSMDDFLKVMADWARQATQNAEHTERWTTKPEELEMLQEVLDREAGWVPAPGTFVLGRNGKPCIVFGPVHKPRPVRDMIGSDDREPEGEWLFASDPFDLFDTVLIIGAERDNARPEFHVVVGRSVRILDATEIDQQSVQFLQKLYETASQLHNKESFLRGDKVTWKPGLPCPRAQRGTFLFAQYVSEQHLIDYGSRYAEEVLDCEIICMVHGHPAKFLVDSRYLTKA